MLGVDVVDVERLRETLERVPGIEKRLFTATEIAYCRSKHDPIRHFAGTLAVKEAVIKASALPRLVASARTIEVLRSDDGAPIVEIQSDGADEVDVSISHDRGIAVAVAQRWSR